MINNNIYVDKNNNNTAYLTAFAANFALGVLKVSLGAFGYSKLILMDGLLSFSNAIVLLLLWQGDKLDRKDPNPQHPYGYGKIIFVVATFSGFVVLLISMYMFLFSVYSMTWDEIHRSHTGAMMVTVISIFTNEVLYRYLTERGRQQSNNVMLWNAINNRINTVVSSIVLTCIILASVGVTAAERLGVGLVSLILFCVSLRILVKSFSGIMDKIPANKIIKQIKYAAQKVRGVRFVSDIKARYIGSFMHIDISMFVDENLSMKEAGQISRNVELKIIETMPLAREVNAIII